MKLFNKLGLIMLLVVFALAACEKAPDLTYYKDGTAVVLSASATTIVPVPADSTRVILTMNWTSPAYATDSNTYKYIVELDSSTKNFSKPNTIILTGSKTYTITGKQLNNMLLNYGFKLGVPVDLDFRVTSSYANNNEQYKSNIVKVKVTPYNDPSVLVTEKTSVTGTLATASNNSNKFSWGTAFNGYSGVVTYSIEYDSATKNFASPQTIAIGASTYLKQLTEGEMNETALTEGVAGGTTGKIEYRVKAVTAQGAVSYSNTVSVTIATYIPIVRMYLPGSYQGSTGNGNDWDPPTAPELIRDLRTGVFNSMYYIYIYLPAGAQFKVSEGRAWTTAYGTAAAPGSITSNNGGNFTVATAGFYRITVNRTTLKYDIREGRMGFVGDATAAGWNPPNVFPATAMGNSGTNLFVGLSDFVAGGWKMIDNNAWDNGSKAVDETRSYGSAGASGSNLDVNGPNMPNITTAGRYRLIWDGRSIDNVKYEMSPATEMRVVGDGIQGVNAWDPPASPKMTYIGAGKWQLSLTLIGGKSIKFLGGNDWPNATNKFLDYEDNSGGLISTGIPRKIKWDGGGDFKTPTLSGTYTIVLDENAQTVTIN